MHSPKKRKKTSLAIHTKLSMCRVSQHDMSHWEIRGGHWKKGRTKESRSNSLFYTMQRINPLGSIVSIKQACCTAYTD
ncbi:unnamed protein product [Staurois parvus]|uniref:Uncharacterized protein n=1 Tax=Staurois parvus TaxID=386267 RepID=A0ABN9DS06_9NEOB|nr:unnamed protein product [Staurois parvus]